MVKELGPKGLEVRPSPDTTQPAPAEAPRSTFRRRPFLDKTTSDADLT